MVEIVVMRQEGDPVTQLAAEAIRRVLEYSQALFEARRKDGWRTDETAPSLLPDDDTLAGAIVDDIEAALMRFAVQMAAFADLRSDTFPRTSNSDSDMPVTWLPCASLDNTALLPVDLFLTPTDLHKQNIALEGLVKDRLRDWHSANIQWVETRSVLALLRTRLAEFLAIRTQGSHRPTVTSAGINVMVSTLTHGLTVHYSPAYFVNRYLVWGAPSSPVMGLIGPGRYVFGAVGPSQPLRFDLQSHWDVPPHTSVHLQL